LGRHVSVLHRNRLSLSYLPSTVSSNTSHYTSRMLNSRFQLELGQCFQCPDFERNRHASF
jgi:hypothetical protein